MIGLGLVLWSIKSYIVIHISPKIINSTRNEFILSKWVENSQQKKNKSWNWQSSKKTSWLTNFQFSGSCYKNIVMIFQNYFILKWLTQPVFRILGTGWAEIVQNSTVTNARVLTLIGDIIDSQRLVLFGHVVKLNDNRVADRLPEPVKHGGLVVIMLDYGSWGREFKSHRGTRIVNLQNGCLWVDSALMSTPCVYLVEGKTARERRWPPPS